MATGYDWLSHLPLEYLGLDMDRQTFRDAIALRMGVDIPDPFPTHCPSCGEAGFDVRHALKCKAGDWVRRRHDEVVKAWMALFRRSSATVVGRANRPGAQDDLEEGGSEGRHLGHRHPATWPKHVC